MPDDEYTRITNLIAKNYETQGNENRKSLSAGLNPEATETSKCSSLKIFII
jgi:hypothetical protein